MALRVVIAGAGLMGRWHADAARHAGGEIVGVVDTDLDRARALTGSGAASPSLAELIPLRPDVVHVCTPIASHAALCGEALAAGCHVIVEKPVTTTGVEAMELADLARRSSRLIVPVHQFVFQRGVQEIRSRLTEFGAIRHVEFATASAGADRAGSDRDAIAAEIIPHAFALARHLLGTTVGDLAWELHRPIAGEWRATAVTPAGATVSALISLASRPTFARWSVLGESTSATADLFHGFAMFEPGHASRQYKIVRPMAVGLKTTLAATANLMARGVRRERAYPGLRALCNTAYAAMQGRGPLPFRDDELADVAVARDRVVALSRAR